MTPSFVSNKKYLYNKNDIIERSTKSHQTHHSKILSAIYRVSSFLTTPVAHGVHDILVLKRKGTGYGADLGPGGESKRFKVVTAIAWLSLALLTLPLVILGIIGKQVFHPGQGKDKLVFMNAAANSYKPPQLNDEEEIRMATYNVAWLPAPVDAIKDVYASDKRAEETAEWIKKQDVNELPLFIGLQEAFDPEASRAFTNGIKDLYPYAVTNAGWADTPLLGSNSGLQFHSRVPIRGAVFLPFQDLVGFGVKCSDRGLLLVNVDLGNKKHAIVAVTHLQAHAEYDQVRENELKAITDLMKDIKEKNNFDGHFYLMGDLNVSNVDDESLKQIDEHVKFRQEDGCLAPSIFYDPYLEDHDEHGEGTFYKGADQLDRGEDGYGTETFYEGPGDAVPDCRYDYILRMVNDINDVTGKVEIINVVSDKFRTCPLSDHKMVYATFKKKVKNDTGN